jgi:hypothetical protein
MVASFVADDLPFGREVPKALLQARSKSVIFPLNSAFRAPFRGAI